MIVRDAVEAWQLVQQPHHADLCGQFVRAWGNSEFVRPEPFEAMLIAATRHDDGWAIWERAPRLTEGNGGKPLPFLEVSVPSHLAFYRGCIADVIDHDPYAGLLVSTHASGIYRSRYGTVKTAALKRASEFQPQVDKFVEEEEARQRELIAELGISDEERWVNYRLLQVFDRLSLYFSGLFEIGRDDVHTIGPVPTDYEGGETEIRLESLGAFEPYSPTHVSIDPYPFGTRPARFTLQRRLMSKTQWTPEEFVERFEATPPEPVEIVLEPVA